MLGNFGTYVLVEEAGRVLVEEVEYWWKYTHARMEVERRTITWENFKNAFLEKYFSKDVHNKEMKFHKLKQENMTVVDYATNFEELLRCKIYKAGVTYCNSMGLAKEKKFGSQSYILLYHSSKVVTVRETRRLCQPNQLGVVVEELLCVL
ncbi:hypothetical protein CR513_54127, partial [Mucuna pruriens]